MILTSFADPVYGAGFLMIYCTRSELLDYKGKLHALKVLADSLRETPGVLGKYMHVEATSGKQVHLVWIDSESSEDERGTCIYHEALHVTFRVLGDRGLVLDANSEEAFCYYQGYVASQLYKGVKK